MDSMADACEAPELIWPKIHSRAIIGEDNKTNESMIILLALARPNKADIRDWHKPMRQ